MLAPGTLGGERRTSSGEKKGTRKSEHRGGRLTLKKAKYREKLALGDVLKKVWREREKKDGFRS